MTATFKAKPAPRRPVNITVADLVHGIGQYLGHIGIVSRRMDFEPFYRNVDIDTNGTAFEIHGISENGVPWEHGSYIFFEIYEKACRVETSRIGPGPFEIFLVASIEKASPHKGCRVVADLNVLVGDDRSLTFQERTPPREYAPNLKLRENN